MQHLRRRCNGILCLFLGVEAFFGALLAGIVVGSRRREPASAVEAVKGFSFAFFVPVYFAIVGLQLGRLLAGSVIVETIFARQGIGQLAIDSILARDYPVVQGVILLTATTYVVANLIVDVSYGFINPRIRAA